METDFLIIGQGLCGTWLSYYLQQHNCSFVVIDEENTSSATRVASGIINPVTGRRIVKTWMIDELIPFVRQAYAAIGQTLNITCIDQKDVIDFFPTPQMRVAFTERYQKDKEYLSLPADENDWRNVIRYDFGYGIIQPAYLIDLSLLLKQQRNLLLERKQLLSAHFDISKLAIKNNAVEYEDITAKKIIFCDGAAGFENPYFKNLPYGANKGEAIWVEINDMPATHILKKGYSLVPWKDNIFWLGSTYLWEFEDAQPTKGFYQFADNWLKQTIQLPYTIIDHKAAIRPATLERRPFVGIHPLHPNVGILNGMGTKGCSLAPWFAKQLADSFINGGAIQPDANVQRFSRILSR